MKTNKLIGSLVGRLLGADPAAMINIEPMGKGKIRMVVVCHSVRLRNSLCEEVQPENKDTIKLPSPSNPRVFLPLYKASFLFDRHEPEEFVPARPFEFGHQDSIRRRNDSVRQHESDAASAIGGRRHVASGAMSSLKSDASGKYWQLEAKLTSHLSMGLKFDWLDKITREAREQDKLPVLFIRFSDAPQESICEADWMVIPSSVFDRMDVAFHGR